MTRFVSLAAVGLTVLLGACSAVPPAPAPPTVPAVDETALWQAHEASVQPLVDWVASGKAGYRLPDDAGSANLRWRQQGEHSELQLSGPLGAGAVTLDTVGPLLRLTRDGIERLYPADAAPWLGGETLLPIPVRALGYWLRGVPAPDLPLEQLDTRDGLARTLAQGGWLIDYQDYLQTDGYRLPRRLHIEAPQAGLSLRLILRDWALPDG